MATIIPEAKTQFLDMNGDPLVDGTVTSFIPGTSTGKNTWNSPEATAVNPNPVVLDAAGRGSIFGDGTNYRQVVRDRNGNLIWDQETGIPPSTGGALTGTSLIVGGDARIDNNLSVGGNEAIGGDLTVDGNETVDGLMTANAGFFSMGNFTAEGPNSVFKAGLVVQNAPGQAVAFEVDGGDLLVTSNRIICRGGNSPSFSAENTSDGTNFSMWNANSHLEFGRTDVGGNPVGNSLAFFDGTQLFVFGNVNVTGQYLINGVPHSLPLGLDTAPDGQYLMTKRGSEISVVPVQTMPADAEGRMILFVK